MPDTEGPTPEPNTTEDATAALANVQRAAAYLAEAINRLPALPPIEIPRLRIPRFGPLIPAEPVQVNPRRVMVTVEAAPLPGRPPQAHTYSDPGGLRWGTYGSDHEGLGGDRVLELQDEDGDVVASYPAGTYLRVWYTAYGDTPGDPE